MQAPQRAADAAAAQSAPQPAPANGAQAAAPDPLVQRYLQHARVEKRLAERTLALYALDLQKLAQFAGAAGVGLLLVQHHQVRRWVAQMHSGGRSGRGIALVLSGWRGFYAWAGRAGLVPSNPVLDVRAPRAAKPLPKALSVDDSVRFAEFQAKADDPWLEARDAATSILSACGIEVTDLDVVTTPGVAMMVKHLNADAGIKAKLSQRWFSEFKVQWQRDSTPAPDAVKDDLKFLLGVGYTF